MKVLVITPDRNSWPKKDFTGAFLPAVRAIEKSFVGNPDVRVVHERVAAPAVEEGLQIEAKETQQKFEAAGLYVTGLVRSHVPDRIVIISHGWPTGLQVGLRSAPKTLQDGKTFAAFCEAAKDVSSITLLACSAGERPRVGQSFAERLCAMSGVPVVAHHSAGHATKNPDLVFFHGPSSSLRANSATRRARRERMTTTNSWIDLIFVDDEQKFERVTQ